MKAHFCGLFFFCLVGVLMSTELPKDFNDIFANATATLRATDGAHFNLNQIELIKLGAAIGWKMCADQKIDLTTKYAEIKEFLGDGNRSSLAGYRLGITDAQNILFKYGITKTKGPIANKPEGFKE